MDKQIHNRIMCDCGKYALLFWGTVPVCGDCAMLMQKAKDRKFKKELEEARCQE